MRPEGANQWPAAPVLRSRMLPWLDWKFSILLPVALLLILGTAIWQLVNRPDLIELTVQNSSTGEPIAGAEVVVNDLRYAAGDDGIVSFEQPEQATGVQVSALGFQSLNGEVGSSTGDRQTVSLQPSTLMGRLSDETTGEPIGAANIAIFDAAGAVVGSTQTDDSGSYRLIDVPEGASVRIDAGAYGTLTQDVGGETELNFPLALTVATGTVVNEAGEPLQGAVAR
ncbi:MAG: carboxypeptidase-like regulatory domain-containing protein, partial [Chloroflexota bacterium]|nr:carboxypeptidase-like regulatory domain-containing protein [Chloroflexota bacterium]